MIYNVIVALRNLNISYSDWNTPIMVTVIHNNNHITMINVIVNDRCDT